MKNMEYLVMKVKKKKKDSMLYNETWLQLYENNIHSKSKAKKEINKNFTKVGLRGLIVRKPFFFLTLKFPKNQYYLIDKMPPQLPFKIKTEQNLYKNVIVSKKFITN